MSTAGIWKASEKKRDLRPVCNIVAKPCPGSMDRASFSIGVKLPGHRPGPFDGAHGSEHAEELPGKVISCYIVPLYPAYLPTGRQARRALNRAGTGRGLHAAQALALREGHIPASSHK